MGKVIQMQYHGQQFSDYPTKDAKSKSLSKSYVEKGGEIFLCSHVNINTLNI